MPYQLHATVCTPVGTFTGFLTADIEDYDEVCAQRDTIQAKMHVYPGLTMFCDQIPGTEISLCEHILKNSVFVMKITNFDAAKTE